jgi:hypothetical protein
MVIPCDPENRDSELRNGCVFWITKENILKVKVRKIICSSSLWNNSRLNRHSLLLLLVRQAHPGGNISYYGLRLIIFIEL